jgi:hypothetical protein
MLRLCTYCLSCELISTRKWGCSHVPGRVRSSDDPNALRIWFYLQLISFTLGVLSDFCLKLVTNSKGKYFFLAVVRGDCSGMGDVISIGITPYCLGIPCYLKSLLMEYLFIVIFSGSAGQRGGWPPHFTRFLGHTQRRATVGRTLLDEWSGRRRDLYLATHNRQTSMPR